MCSGFFFSAGIESLRSTKTLETKMKFLAFQIIEQAQTHDPIGMELGKKNTCSKGKSASSVRIYCWVLTLKNTTNPSPPPTLAPAIKPPHARGRTPPSAPLHTTTTPRRPFRFRRRRARPCRLDPIWWPPQHRQSGISSSAAPPSR